jgi:hypothetical protein
VLELTGKSSMDVTPLAWTLALMRFSLRTMARRDLNLASQFSLVKIVLIVVKSNAFFWSRKVTAPSLFLSIRIALLYSF